MTLVIGIKNTVSNPRRRYTAKLVLDAGMLFKNPRVFL